MKKLLLVCTLLVTVSACTGIRRSGDTFTAHAESLNLIGFQIPENDYPAAVALIPEGAQVHTVTSNPSDWTSILGVINRIIGIGYPEISGKVQK